MRGKPSFSHIVWNLIFIFGGLLLCWVAAYYLMGSVYVWIKWEPHELLSFLIYAVLGFIIFGICIFIVGLFIKRKEHQFWAELIEALRRISQGDFLIRIDPGFGDRRGRHRENPLFQLVDSINDMAANLKEMEELRQEFISNVSHEIGSPLTSISGFAKALKDDHLDREQRNRYLTIIETECVRLSKLSDNLLKLAILDSDRNPVHPASYRLDKQLVSLILACEPQWEGKQIEMEADLKEVEVVADEDMMSQVWINLIHNSIKFTPEGGTIRISLARTHDQAIVRVADTGPGIAEQDLLRIFERFYKADKSRNRTASGSGLGLSIACKITEMHSGSITVSSKPGEGAEFTVSLPLQRS